MKIIMLGHTGVGKTTYMASMYGTLQAPINGFSLLTQNSTHHTELLNEFRKIRQGRYPLATAQRGQYDFSLVFQGKPVFPFQWIDYRGGALIERQNTSVEAQRLVSELCEADGILMFCDSDPKVRMKVKSQIGRMITLVGQAVRNGDKALIIAVIFTKADLVDGLDDEMIEPLQGLFDAISRSKAHIGTLLPVACGSQLINPEAPVLFALHFGILFQTIRLLSAIEYYQALEKAYITKGETLGGIFSDIWNGWVGKPTTADHARRARLEAQAEKAEISKLEQPAQGLAAYLEDLPIVVGEALSELFSK